MATEMHVRMRGFAVVVAGLALVLAGGCAEPNVALGPGGLSGITDPQVEQQLLTEPENPPEALSYASSNAHRTMGVPVRLKIPDRNLNFTVNSVKANWLATPYVVSKFAGGEIVEREFKKVFEANFREPVGGEAPVAELAVRIAMVLVSQKSDWAPIESTLSFNIEVTKPGGSEIAYSKSIDSSAIGPWSDRSQIPLSFYQALSKAIAKFLDDWEQSGGPDTVARWAGDAGTGVVPPKLRAIAWETGAERNGVQRGRCEVACNGFEGFRAKHWATAQIAEACRTKLGNIEPERVRVVYDKEYYNPEAGTWRFAFRCFARNERVLDYNAVTGMGTVIGDLGLMKMKPEDAAEELEAYVLETMRSHGGPVTKEHPKTEAYVRFDNYRTDPANNLIIIDFRMLR